MTTTLVKNEFPSRVRHRRKCGVCKHKDREDIELDFLHWHNCTDIAADYGFNDPRVIYRHAHATGLFERRMLNLKCAVAHIVENAESITPSGAAVLKAIQACAQINEHGVWIEPPRRIIHQIEHHHVTAPLPDKPTQLPADESESSEPAELSNRHWMRLENAATPTKH